MANATVSNLGQANGSGATDALFLKIFSGEVLTAFTRATIAMGRTSVRSIMHGKSAAFPVTWRNTAAYHTPGEEIVGNAMLVNERVITIDGLLTSSVFIAVIDEAKNHFEVRSEYSKQCGESLAVTLDKNIFQVGVLAARASAVITGADAGSSLINASYKTDASTLAAGIFLAAQKLDEKSVAESERSCFVLPAQYYLLAQNTTAINSQFGGKGAYSDGSIMSIAGIEIVKTLNLPSTNVNTGPTAYQVDATNTAALVMNKQAVGTVKLLDLATESAYDIRRQGTLIVAKMAVGHGILRPEAAVELKTA
jgi:hypothetical protein